MPVWHEMSKPWRQEHDLVVLGITQEQHPERCRLFAQWKGLDFPILWDPFNLTGARAVPLVMLVDGAGVVVSERADPESARAFAQGPVVGVRKRVEVLPHEDEARLAILDLLEDAAAVRLLEDVPAVAEGRDHVLDSVRERAIGNAGQDVHHRAAWAMSGLLWHARRMTTRACPPTLSPVDIFVGRLRAAVTEQPDLPGAHFRLGVALRMRHDGPWRRSADFADAVASWSRALELDPGQYIWRRRIQQYGPLLDKPYPFYDWVDEAREQITARGETPIALRVALSGTERVGRGGPESSARAMDTAPDPEGLIPRVSDGWMDVSVVVVPDTRGRKGVARVHIELRPGAEDVHWNNEVEPPVLWLDAGDGVSFEPPGLRGQALPLVAVSDEARGFDVEVRRADQELVGSGLVLDGYVLFHACEGASGECQYLRQDLRVTF